MSLVSISLKNITKTFDDVIANNNISLDIEEGELFTLLGPSGCGKTTTLRIIAGFYLPDSGTILFDDQDVTHLPPDKRGTGMVFQNYALWPHMKVFDNIAYGLKIRKTPSDVIKERVKETLELVKLGGLESRTPFQLSGGQQQRVALARALVIEPNVLLLDEPLSNLDAKLRLEMRQEITRIQKELKITTLYVTHDQEEALSISDRIAVQRGGVIQQVGIPREIYKNPKTVFIADFIGHCTFIPGSITAINDCLDVVTDAGIHVRALKSLNFSVGDKVICAIRPENLLIDEPTSDYNAFECEIESVIFLGTSNRVYGKNMDLTLIAELPINIDVARGDKLILYSLIEETTVLPFSN